MKQATSILDKIIYFIIALAIYAGTAEIVFDFIENLTVAVTGSPLAGLFAGGIISLLYTAGMFYTLWKLIK